jgi:hypothetical protein
MNAEVPLIGSCRLLKTTSVLFEVAIRERLECFRSGALPLMPLLLYWVEAGGNHTPHVIRELTSVGKRDLGIAPDGCACYPA